MAITPQAGYELDPNNPNRVRKIGEQTTPDMVGTSISSANLGGQPAPNFQSFTEPPVYNVAGLTPDMTLTQPEQEAQNQFVDLTELNKQLLGESAYRAEQEQAQGVAEKNQAVTELSSRLKSLQNEALAIPLQLQQEATGRGVTAGGLRPIETAALRNNAIQALSTNSLLEASRGNLTLAQDMADRAVAQKFDPIKERIAVTQKNLDLILKSPAYSLAEKNRAQRQKDIQDARAREVEKQAENEKIVLGWMAEATKNNPQASFQIQQANGKTPQQALSLLAPYLSDPNAKAKALAELDQTRAQTALIQANTRRVNKEIQDMGIPATISPEAGKYAPALGIILGSGKFTKDQKASIIASVNGGEDPFTVIKNQAKSILGQTGENKLTSYEVAREQLDQVKNSLASYYASGGKTDIFSGNYEKVLNSLGNVKDPKLVEIATEIAASLQIYRNAVSGTAYSVQEGRDIAAIFPGINKTQGLNDAILAGRMRAFESTIDSTYRSALGKTYDDLKASQTPTPTATDEQIVNGVTYVKAKDGLYYPK